MSVNSRRFDYLSWPKAKDALAREGSTLVWPFGACEQHGPHLPLATDSLFSERILTSVIRRMPLEVPIWTLPPQPLGFSPEHESFPGTISLSAPLMMQLVMEVGSCLAKKGLRRLVFFNAHGGQIGLLQAAARQLRLESPSMAVLPCFLWSGVEALNKLIPSIEANQGLHAGLAETSLMLSIESELVGPDRPCDGKHTGPNSPATPPDGWSLEGPAPCAWLTSDLSDSGVIGDSRESSLVLGEALESALVDHWVDRLTVLMASNWPPVARN